MLADKFENVCAGISISITGELVFMDYIYCEYLGNYGLRFRGELAVDFYDGTEFDALYVVPCNCDKGHWGP